MNLLFAGLLFGISTMFSAFCSGTETAFYRASRVKIVMNVLEGDRLSMFLAWLTNHPAFFVATILVANNIANYLVSFSIVLTTTTLFTGNSGASAEMFATILLTPLLFVYGESLPKSIGFQAPNRILKFATIPLMLVSLVLSPISAMLWGFSRVIERFLGQSPERLQMSLARKEIEQVLDEGHEVGILHASQRQLSQNFFLVAGKPIRQVCLPLNRIVSVKLRMTRIAAIKVAQRHNLSDIPLTSVSNELLGYYHLVDLLVMPASQVELPEPRQLQARSGDEAFGEVLLWMQSHRETLIKVVDKQSQLIGLLSMDQLTSQLLRGPLESLRR